MSPAPLRGAITHVIFDFDGTLSWLRHGWPQLMAEVFHQYYPIVPGETEREIRDFLLSELLALNGKQSIFQMRNFCEQVRRRGGSCPSPEELLAEYQGRLDALIAQRTEQILLRSVPPDFFVVHGARPFLEFLADRGIRLIILSGTIQHRVAEEARLLQLDGFFGNHIYGGTPNPAHFSKRKVIDRLIESEKISGRHLLSFGDGPVEMEETKAVGGTAIAVASDEEDNTGHSEGDPIKRRQLLAAGADFVIPDFRGAPALWERVKNIPPLTSPNRSVSAEASGGA